MDYGTCRYQSTVLGSFQTVEFIETFVNYYESIKKCVCIVYDPQRSTRGSISMTAIRLKDSFIEAYKESRMSAEKMREANISWKDIFQEVPIKVHNSSLISAMFTECGPDRVSSHSDADRLNLSLAPFLEKNMESLIACVNDLVAEQQNVSQYHKNVARQQQQQANWLQKRRQENIARKAAGEEPLPEEDPVMFKPVSEPSQLDAYLITNQISTYCDQINAASTQSLQKMYLMEAFQNAII